MRRKLSWQQEEDFLKASFQFSLEDALEWIQKNLNPEDVYEEKDLEYWAEQNGYIEEAP